MITLSVILSSSSLCRLFAHTHVVLSLVSDGVVQLGGIRAQSSSTKNPISTARVAVSQGSSTRIGTYPLMSVSGCIFRRFLPDTQPQFSSPAQGKSKTREQQENPLIREYEVTETRLDCTMFLLREEEEDPRTSVQVLGTAEWMLQKKGKSFFV